MEKPGGAGVVVMQDLTKAFGPVRAVKGLSLEIHEGEIFGFLGPNGAGKTTAIRMMCGLLQPDHGSVFLHGRALQPGSGSRGERVGYCPQHLVVWTKLTCLEQLVFMGRLYGLSGRQARSRGLELLSQLGLAHKAHHTAATLSGGMLRRLNILLAVVHNPDILILDEPEAGLDPQSKVLVRDYIRSLATKKTVVLTTHNMDEAERMCYRIAIIDEGKLLTIGSLEDYRTQFGLGSAVTFEWDAEKPEALVLQVLKDFHLEGFVAGNRIRIPDNQALPKLPGLLLKFHECGIEIHNLRVSEMSLEDIFIQLTGKKLRE